MRRHALVQRVPVAHAPLGEQKLLPGQNVQREGTFLRQRMPRRCNETHRLRHVRSQHQRRLQKGLVQRVDKVYLIGAQQLQHLVRGGGVQHQLHLRAAGMVALQQSGQKGAAHGICQRDAQAAPHLLGGLQGSLCLLGSFQQGAGVA